MTGVRFMSISMNDGSRHFIIESRHGVNRRVLVRMIDNSIPTLSFARSVRISNCCSCFAQFCLCEDLTPESYGYKNFNTHPHAGCLNEFQSHFFFKIIGVFVRSQLFVFVPVSSNSFGTLSSEIPLSSYYTGAFIRSL
jgi:hypothetical protein